VICGVREDLLALLMGPGLPYRIGNNLGSAKHSERMGCQEQVIIAVGGGHPVYWAIFLPYNEW
jgi:hypothetical protein